jgi:hypothetical protein
MQYITDRGLTMANMNVSAESHNLEQMSMKNFMLQVQMPNTHKKKKLFVFHRL